MVGTLNFIPGVREAIGSLRLGSSRIFWVLQRGHADSCATAQQTPVGPEWKQGDHVGGSCVSLFSLQEWTFPTSLFSFVWWQLSNFLHSSQCKKKKKKSSILPLSSKLQTQNCISCTQYRISYFAVIYVSVWFSWPWVPYGQDLFSFFHVFLAPWCGTWYLIALKQSLMSEWTSEWTNEQLVWLTLNLQRLVWLNRGRL